jgi:hypothetical protein
MQKNCHEFIAYENLAGSRGGRSTDRGKPGGTSPIAQALPLVKRALKVLSEREVAPQLGLLKSTLLQLDSTFSEREYGAGSFRDFMEKVSQTGAVTLKSAGRSMLVEQREEGDVVEIGVVPEVRPAAPSSIDVAPSMPADEGEEEETLPSSPMSMQDGIRAVQRAFTRPEAPPRWPMYVRQAKQFLRTAIESFDERKYGFASVVDLLRAAAREGVVRLERDRQGAVRVFPGQHLEAKAAAPAFDAAAVEESDPEVTTEALAAEMDTAADTVIPEPVEEAPIVEVTPIEAVASDDVVADHEQEDDEDEVDGNRLQPLNPKPRRRTASPSAAKTSRSKPKTAARPAVRRRPDPRAKTRQS